MGDHAQYREIMTKLFIDGEEPSEIWYTDGEGKSHRLTEPQKRKVRGRPSKDLLDQARALQARLKAGKDAAARLTSSGDE